MEDDPWYNVHMLKNPRIIIIGAGPCGLGAGWRLTELGVPFTIYEKASAAGGLASSFVDDKGFTWDVGGHVLHSHYPYFDNMFETVMRGEYFTHQRESWVWIAGRFVPYPFQNNIHRLPPKVMRECLAGLRKTSLSKNLKPKNFAEWIAASFGAGIAKHFLLPYNRKVWAYPPEKMNYGWVGDRVATLDIARIERNIRNNSDDVSWGPNAVFHFPKHGGTGEIWRRVAKRFEEHIRYGKKVVRVDAKKRIIFFHDGTNDSYDVLLSTIPLPILLAKRTPLASSSVTIVGLGMKGEVPEYLKTKCWMYFPENKAPFFRATVFSNYSKFNAPKGHWSLMTEVSFSKYRPLLKGDIVEAVIRGAKNTKLIHEKPVSVWVFTSTYGYPTPTLGRDAFLHKILPLLEGKNIFSRGRFGAWKYEVSNQDHTFMQGVEWSNRMILGQDEITVYNPREVNSPKKS